MYIVGFNGPPRSGKDTMARMLAEHMDAQGVILPVLEASLSTPLRKIAFEMCGLDYHDSKYEAFKITKFPAFGNKTGRELMIDVSERFLKPLYGKAIMAKLLLQELEWFPGIVLVRDCGFQIEQAELASQVGANNFYVAQVLRHNTSFADDSREWVYHEHWGVYRNNGELTDLKTEAERLYGRLVNQMGWKL